MSSHPILDIALIVNAGGDSRRMGASKALLAVPPDNHPLLQHIVERLATIRWNQIVVVANQPDLSERLHLPVNVTFVADTYPGMGALGGIATGLERCSGWALVVATDMPLVNPRLCEWLCQQTLVAREGVVSSTPYDVIMPQVGGKLQPLHALYHVRALPAIRAQLTRGERMIVRFLDNVQTRIIPVSELQPYDPNLHSFVNVNTPAEWEAALALLYDEQPHQP